jgi:hypothetical protein
MLLALINNFITSQQKSLKNLPPSTQNVEIQSKDIL